MERGPSQQQDRPRTLRSQAVLPLLTLLLAITSPLAAQTMPVSVGVLPHRLLLCNVDQFATAELLTLKQRACWYGSAIASPWAVFRAGLSSGIGQWRNNPYVLGQDGDDYLHRLALYYVRRSARETGDLLAGYLHHEDFRPRLSGQTTIQKRIRSALMSVLVTSGDEGGRPAIGPIVGSLAAAAAEAAFDPEYSSPGYAARQAGITYASYFGKALYQEFQPDLLFFVKRALHKTR